LIYSTLEGTNGKRLAVGMLAVRIIQVQVNSDGPTGAINVSLKLAPDALSLKSGTAGMVGKVKELFVVLNAAGKVVGQQSAMGQFAVPPEKQAAFRSHGVTIEQALQLPADAVSLSIIVQDTGTGRMGSLTVPLEKVTPAKMAPSACVNRLVLPSHLRKLAKYRHWILMKQR
jgi:hypothetical protein